ncbi:MAG: GntR family transcriptional regulator [Dehalococcoidia bacterium]|nr:GntR family transcriptional regulator [Dehalococcoidia bacterium]
MVAGDYAPSTDTVGKIAPIDRSTLAEEIYRRLRRTILAGELQPGQRIRPDQLANDIGVSRTPVREALQRLLAEGYLEQEARHAFRVAAVDYRSGWELFEIRAVLEGLAARAVARKLSDADRARLEETINAIDVDRGLYPDKAVGDFHRIMYYAAESKSLQSLLDRVYDQTLRYRFLTRSDTPDKQRETHDDHRAILQAVLDRDGDRAEQLMREHVMKLAKRFEQHLPDKS